MCFLDSQSANVTVSSFHTLFSVLSMEYFCLTSRVTSADVTFRRKIKVTPNLLTGTRCSTVMELGLLLPFTVRLYVLTCMLPIKGGTETWALATFCIFINALNGIITIVQ